MRVWSCLIALPLLGTAFFAGRASVQDDMTAMMPGKHHEFLKPMVGTWKAHGKFMGPMPMEIEGTMESRMVMGGRFLEQRFEGPFMGMDFEGYGLWGYSNPDGQYQSLWIDNMSTHFSVSLKGEASADGKTITSYAQERDQMTGEMHDVKDVTVIKSNDEHVFTRYRLDGGQESPTMEFTYTRK